MGNKSNRAHKSTAFRAIPRHYNPIVSRAFSATASDTLLNNRTPEADAMAGASL
jgi:hypothetical protein